jgi:uncharacterized protein (DUF169 family)
VDCYVRLVQLQRRMKIAELKQQCLKPDVVEVMCQKKPLSSGS